MASVSLIPTESDITSTQAAIANVKRKETPAVEYLENLFTMLVDTDKWIFLTELLQSDNKKLVKYAYYFLSSRHGIPQSPISPGNASKLREIADTEIDKAASHFRSIYSLRLLQNCTRTNDMNSLLMTKIRKWITTGGLNGTPTNSGDSLAPSASSSKLRHKSTKSQLNANTTATPSSMVASEVLFCLRSKFPGALLFDPASFSIPKDKLGKETFITSLISSVLKLINDRNATVARHGLSLLCSLLSGALLHALNQQNNLSSSYINVTNINRESSLDDSDTDTKLRSSTQSLASLQSSIDFAQVAQLIRPHVGLRNVVYPPFRVAPGAPIPTQNSSFNWNSLSSHPPSANLSNGNQPNESTSSNHESSKQPTPVSSGRTSFDKASPPSIETGEDEENSMWTLRGINTSDITCRVLWIRTCSKLVQHCLAFGTDSGGSSTLTKSPSASSVSILTSTLSKSSDSNGPPEEISPKSKKTRTKVEDENSHKSKDDSDKKKSKSKSKASTEKGPKESKDKSSTTSGSIKSSNSKEEPQSPKQAPAPQGSKLAADTIGKNDAIKKKIDVKDKEKLFEEVSEFLLDENDRVSFASMEALVSFGWSFISRGVIKHPETKNPINVVNLIKSRLIACLASPCTPLVHQAIRVAKSIAKCYMRFFESGNDLSPILQVGNNKSNKTGSSSSTGRGASSMKSRTMTIADASHGMSSFAGMSQFAGQSLIGADDNHPLKDIKGALQIVFKNNKSQYVRTQVLCTLVWMEYSWKGAELEDLILNEMRTLITGTQHGISSIPSASNSSFSAASAQTVPSADGLSINSEPASQRFASFRASHRLTGRHMLASLSNAGPSVVSSSLQTAGTSVAILTAQNSAISGDGLVLESANPQPAHNISTTLLANPVVQSSASNPASIITSSLLVEELNREFIERIKLSPLLADTLLSVHFKCFLLSPSRVNSKSLTTCWRIIMETGEPETKQKVLNSIFQMLDVSHRKETRISLFSVNKIIYWFLGEYGTELAGEVCAELPLTSNIANDVPHFPITNPWTRALISRLEYAVTTTPWEVRVVCLEALAKLAFKGSYPVRLRVYEFCNLVARNLSGSSLFPVAVPIIHLLDRIFDLRSGWVSRYHSGKAKKNSISRTEILSFYEAIKQLIIDLTPYATYNSCTVKSVPKSSTHSSQSHSSEDDEDESLTADSEELFAPFASATSNGSPMPIAYNPIGKDVEKFLIVSQSKIQKAIREVLAASLLEKPMGTEKSKSSPTLSKAGVSKKKNSVKDGEKELNQRTRGQSASTSLKKKSSTTSTAESKSPDQPKSSKTTSRSHTISSMTKDVAKS